MNERRVSLHNKMNALYFNSRHQIGFFRDLNLNNRNNNNQPAGNQPAGNQPAGNQPAGNQPADNQNQPPLVVVNNQPSILAVTWMIFTSFFASLIPDINQ